MSSSIAPETSPAVGVSTNYSYYEDEDGTGPENLHESAPLTTSSQQADWVVKAEEMIQRRTTQLRASRANSLKSASVDDVAVHDEEEGLLHEEEKQHIHLTHEKAPLSPQKAMIHKIVTITLMIVYIFSAAVFSLRPETEGHPAVLAVDNVMPVFLYTDPHRTCDILYADLVFYPPDRGPLPINVTVQLQELNPDTGFWEDVADEVYVFHVDKSSDNEEETSFSAPEETEPRGGTDMVELEHTFKGPTNGNQNLRFWQISSSSVPLPYSFKLVQTPQAGSLEVLYAAIILVFVYTLIIFEVVHRAMAAIIGSFVALMFVAVLKERAPLEEVVQWIDYETVCLLFGMMIMVSIVAQTGAFEYAAVQAYKLSKGNIWVLITILVVFTAISSAFLDNVTTILLMAPVTIRLCQVVNLDPRPILMAEVLFCNIGGTATGVGDPPNVIILGSPLIKAYGIDFSEFTIHMMVGSIICCFVGYFFLRFQMRNIKFEEDSANASLEREIFVWRRQLQGLNDNIAEEVAVKRRLEHKLAELEDLLENERQWGHESKKQTIEELEKQYRIHNMPLFINSMIVLSVTILLFFIHSVPGIHLSIGWIAMMGAFALLLIAGDIELEKILEKLEWATLIFFAALFVMMECIDELGLLVFIGEQLASLIGMVSPEYQLIVAITLIVWVSAFASAFIDNIPFTTAMIPIIIEVAEDPSLDIPLRPLVWSLAYGACLGGNGTQIGASANVVASGLADQYGYNVSFNYFFKYGFPMMIVTVAVAHLYLLFAHGWLGWNNYG